MEPGSFITAFTEAYILPQSKDTWIWSTLFHSVCPRSVLLFLSHLRLGLSKRFFPYDFPSVIVYAFLFLPTPATSPAYIALLELITLMTFGEEYKSWNSSLYIFLDRPFIPSVLPKYVPQHPIHWHRHSVSFPECQRSSLFPVRRQQHQGSVFVFILRFCK